MLNRTHCLIPASGFYEWKAEGLNKKQPYYIHRADGKPMAFAGLWDSWQAQEINELPIVSCAIVTTASNHEMKFVHDRMPIILEPEQWKSWLNADVTDTRKLLVPSKDGALALYPVSTQVNNPKYISHDCIKRYIQKLCFSGDVIIRAVNATLINKKGTLAHENAVQGRALWCRYSAEP
jgi:putative SOS response-associated peptidase YedK